MFLLILKKFTIFIIQGRSKKIAKLNLAKTILLCMYDIHDFKDAMDVTPKSQKKSDETQMEKKFPLTQLKNLAGKFCSISVFFGTRFISWTLFLKMFV